MLLNLEKLSDFLYEERRKQGLKQSELARRTGVYHTMISRYENFCNLKISTFMRLLKGLGFSANIEIHKDDEEPNYHWGERYYELTRQVYPEGLKGLENADSFVHFLAVEYINKHVGGITIKPVMASNTELQNTIAYCEESYAQGYSAIINDGKLMGFREEA